MAAQAMTSKAMTTTHPYVAAPWAPPRGGGGATPIVVRDPGKRQRFFLRLQGGPAELFIPPARKNQPWQRLHVRLLEPVRNDHTTHGDYSGLVMRVSDGIEVPCSWTLAAEPWATWDDAAANRRFLRGPILDVVLPRGAYRISIRNPSLSGLVAVDLGDAPDYSAIEQARARSEDRRLRRDVWEEPAKVDATAPSIRSLGGGPSHFDVSWVGVAGFLILAILAVYLVRFIGIRGAQDNAARMIGQHAASPWHTSTSD
jgi:hypothetical protein